jgi:hypothetical protein
MIEGGFVGLLNGAHGGPAVWLAGTAFVLIVAYWVRGKTA